MTKVRHYSFIVNILSCNAIQQYLRTGTKKETSVPIHAKNTFHRDVVVIVGINTMSTSSTFSRELCKRLGSRQQRQLRHAIARKDSSEYVSGGNRKLFCRRKSLQGKLFLGRLNSLMMMMTTMKMSQLISHSKLIRQFWRQRLC